MSFASVYSFMIRRGLIGAVVLALLTGGFQAVRAQDWTHVSNPYNYGYPITPYFLNENVGFTFNTGIIFNSDELYQISNGLFGITYLPELARTMDGGLNWSALNFFDTSGYSITQLSFVSLTHGYASAGPNYSSLNNVLNSGGIFETFDQGSHWKKISSGGISFSSIYSANGSIFASEIGHPNQPLTGAILYSRDDGVTWDSITNVAGLTLGAQPQFDFIYGNRDSLVATVYFTNSSGGQGNNGNTYIVFSTDLGNTWNSSLLDQTYQWPMVSLHIGPHSCNIVREFLDGQDLGGDMFSFLESSPPYNSWNSALLHRETGAWVAGTTCASYLSDAADGEEIDKDTSVLFFRSTDKGVSWNPILKERGNNPYFTEIDDIDFQNLSVVGYGAVIYASDAFGYREPFASLWKTTDGGDGTLSATDLAPRIEFAHGAFDNGNDTLVLASCSPSSANVYYQNLSCSITKMDSISLIGLPQSKYTLTSTYHNDCLSLPDSTYISFAPLLVGTYPITIKAHFTDDEYNTIDTTISFTLVVQPIGTQPIPISLYLKQTSITAAPGDTIQIPVYLAGNTTLDSTSITLPFGIDTNVLRPIGFQSVISGITVGSIEYSGGTGASSAMLTVPLQFENLALNGETLIGYLRCIVYLADTLATTVTLQSPSLTSANAPCVALSLTTDSVSILINGCGDETLLQFMKSGTFPFVIESIQPNPAQNEIQIRVAGGVPATPLECEMYDALGRGQDVRSTSLQSGVVLDVTNVPSGIYFLRLSMGGFVQSRSVVIAH